MSKFEEGHDGLISTATAQKYVRMWVGPRTAKEIDKTLAGNPTLIDIACGPNQNDGRGGQGAKERCGYYFLEEMHRWLKDRQPKEDKYPCTECDQVFKTTLELVNHFNKEHKPSNVMSTFDAEAAQAARIDAAVDKRLKGNRLANKS